MGCMAPDSAFSQDVDVGNPQKKSSEAHPALRGFAEVGMGALFGTIAGGTSFVTGVYLAAKHRSTDLTATFVTSAVLYPLGVASGAILGGYLTDSRSGYWQPFVGAFSGALIADVTAYFLADDYPVLSALLVVLLPIITTTIAMETSHAWKKRSDRLVGEPCVGTRQAWLHLSFKFAF